MSSNEFDGVERAAGRHRAAARAARRRAGRRRPRRAGPGPGGDRDVPGRPGPQLAGDPAATIAHAERAFDRAAEDDHLIRAAASALSGLASWTIGDLDAAPDRYTVALDGLDAGRAHRRRPRLHDRGRRHRDHPGPARRGEAHLRTLPRARRARGSRRCAGIGRHARRPEPGRAGPATTSRPRRRTCAAATSSARTPSCHRTPTGWRVAAAGSPEPRATSDGARRLLEEAERVYVGDYSPDVHPVPRPAARVQAAARRPRRGPRLGAQHGSRAPPTS